VISFSYVTFAMLPPGYAVTRVDQRVLHTRTAKS
jgi:hypothetical protein